MIYYVWILTEGETEGEQIPAEVSPDPEPSASGEGDGSGELQEEAAPGYTETETETEEENQEEEEINQYGLVDFDYTDSFTSLNDQLTEITKIGYATLFLIAGYILINLIIRILRN